MKRQIRRVPADWQHPKTPTGYYIPLFETFPLSAEEVKKGLLKGWLFADLPDYGLGVMPQWPQGERTHYQLYELYECDGAGTPLSPPLPTAEALATWLTKMRVPFTGPGQFGSYGEWLALIKADTSAAERFAVDFAPKGPQKAFMVGATPIF